MMDPKFSGRPIAAQHMMAGGGRADLVDLDQMPDTPNRGRHHRRTQSESFLRFDDDITLDDAVFDLPPAPSLSSEAAPVQLQLRPPAHLRSLSVDADFFEGLNFGPTSSSSSLDGGVGGGGAASTVGGFAPRHRHSNSMDGSFASAMTTSFEALMVDSEKKTSNDRLHEIAMNDPKRAKRILANRQSAARSKERKIRYTSELERQVQTLQTEATTLSAQVTQLQRDTSVLTVENKELKLHLESMEKQAQLRDALNEKLKEEVQRLKMEAGHMRIANGNNFSRGLRPQFPPQMQAFSNFSNNLADRPQQQQQRQQQQQQQVRMPQSVMNSSGFNSQPHPSFLGFNPNA